MTKVRGENYSINIILRSRVFLQDILFAKSVFEGILVSLMSFQVRKNTNTSKNAVTVDRNKIATGKTYF